MNFIEYIKTLDENSLILIYTSQYLVRGLFQSLPPLAQQYLLRILPVKKISEKQFQSWLTPNAQDVNKFCMKLLGSLKILEKNQK